MISAFARAARGHSTTRPIWKMPAGPPTFLRQRLYRSTDGILLRSYREGPSNVEGFADDYAFLIQGLLDLYEAGFDPAHLAWAEQLQAKQDELFHDATSGRIFFHERAGPERAAALEGGPRRRGAVREFRRPRSTWRGSPP